jgi:UDP-N-acetylmuramate--alanine ligase
MEFIGTIQNNPVYSDYSHHAPAIAGNMQALKRQFPDKKVCVVFQPHQAKRVLAGRDDFANALQGNDQLIIYKLYTAREDFLELQKTSPRLN